MNIESLEVRDVLLTDVESLAKIRIRSWQKTYAGQMPDEYLNNLSLEKTITRWQELVANPERDTKILGAFIDGRLAGYLSMGPNRNMDEINSGEIYAIYVDPDFLGVGIGTRLMNEAISHFISLGYSYATLWVFHSNSPAIKFYESKVWLRLGKVTSIRSEISKY